MEGLIFFIAMTVFIVRTVNKIKKAASGGKKTAKAKPHKKSPVKDKLEELIRNMEEAERLKKEGRAASADEAFFTASSKNAEYSSVSGSAFYPDRDDSESSSEYMENGKRGRTDKIIYDRTGSVKYDLKDKAYNEKSLNKETDERIEKKKTLNKFPSGEERKSSAIPGSIYAVPGTLSSKPQERNKKRGILNAVLKYPELQRAVVLKEILDSPVSEKY